MGHRQQMTREQLLKWDTMQYKAKLDANKGHNYQYWNDTLEKQYEEGVIKIYDTFTLEEEAKTMVNELRLAGNFSRIVCGYEKDVQGTKYFTVIFKEKKNGKK